MEPDIGQIKSIYKKRISLLRELLDCVERERESLINQDINGIWELIEEKNNILESLEESKKHIDKLHHDRHSLNDFPSKEKQTVTELSLILSDLREKIKTRVKENISFITDTMGFFHELVTVMTMSGHAEGSYGPYKNSKKEPLNLLYRSEV